MLLEFGRTLTMKNRPLDSADQLIVSTLPRDARTSLRSLTRLAGLSAPAVGDRIRRLEDHGVIEAFTLELSSKALGYPIEAIVRIEPLPGRLTEVESILRETPEVTTCDVVTGDDCFVARLALRDFHDLDVILSPIHHVARTSTGIVKRSPVTRRPPPL